MEDAAALDAKRGRQIIVRGACRAAHEVAGRLWTTGGLDAAAPAPTQNIPEKGVTAHLLHTQHDTTGGVHAPIGGVQTTGLHPRQILLPWSIGNPDNRSPIGLAGG